MPLQPSRRDILGPPPRDVTDLSKIVRHHGSYLRSLDPGIQDGRFAILQPVHGVGAQLVGDDGGADSQSVLFENSDHATCTGPNQAIRIPLTHTPDEGSEQVYYNGTPLKWSDWYRTDTVLTIPGEPWFRAGKVAWVDYAYYDEEADVDPATFVSVSWVQGNATSLAVPTPAAGTTGAGDMLVLAIAAGEGPACSDPRMALKGTVTAPTFPLPTGGIWVGTDDGSGAPLAISSPSSDGNSVAACMRISGSPLLPATSEATTIQTSYAADFTPTVPSGGSFGVVAIASGVGLVSSTINGDELGNWTLEALQAGAGSGKTSVYLGIHPGGPIAGRWSQFGSNPVFIGWMGGLQ